MSSSSNIEGIHPVDFLSIVFSTDGSRFYIECHRQHSDRFQTLLGSNVYQQEQCKFDPVVVRYWCHFNNNLPQEIRSLLSSIRFSALSFTTDQMTFKVVIVTDGHNVF